MNYPIKHLLIKIVEQSESVKFAEVMQVITDHYLYTPSSFTNGSLINEAGSNEGSCKLFTFAKLHQLTELQTLSCFGQYYRDDVLKNPQGIDHGNIRNFMVTGWNGINFARIALKSKE
ncbi:MAG: HopJ type III effector protein [Colwellia sp.]